MDWQVLRLLSLRVCILSSPRGGGTPCRFLASIGKVLPTLKLNVHFLVSLSRARDKPLHEKALEAIRDANWDGSPYLAVSVLLLLGTSRSRSGELAASVIVQTLNNANMMIVGKKDGFSIGRTQPVSIRAMTLRPGRVSTLAVFCRCVLLQRAIGKRFVQAGCST